MTGGAFAIHPATGVVTVAGTLDHQTTPLHQLTIRASDQLAPVNDVDVTLDIQIVPVPAGYDPGSVVRTFFSGISGASVDDLMNFAELPGQAELGGDPAVVRRRHRPGQPIWQHHPRLSHRPRQRRLHILDQRG